MTRSPEPEHIAAADAELDAPALRWILRWIVLGAVLGALAGGLKAKAWWLFGWDLQMMLTKWVVFGVLIGGFLAGIVAIGVAQKVIWRREHRRIRGASGSSSTTDVSRPRAAPRASGKQP